MLKRWGIFGFCALAALPVAAQDEQPWRPGDEPEVRRARPVEESTPASEPEWMRRLPPELQNDAPRGRIEIQRAEPVSPAPQPTGIPDPPVRTPPPSTPTAPAPPQATPASPAGVPVPMAPADDANTIRLGPRGSKPMDEAAIALEAANSIYSRKMFEFAAMKYEEFLKDFPGAAGRDIALFRLGEACRAESQSARAQDAFRRLTSEFQEGPFFGAASYRLGEAAFADGRYEDALGQFRSAEAHAAEEEVRLSARYQVARCLDRLGRPSEAVPMYREVVEADGANPYRNHARLALAASLAATDQKPEARVVYEEALSGELTDPLRAEALVKAAALDAENGETDRAMKRFEEARRMEKAGVWRAVAVLGTLRLASATDNHQLVAELPDTEIELLSGNGRAEALSIVAASLKALNRKEKAKTTYARLLDEFPQSEFARQARFGQLTILYETADPTALEEIDAFLKSSPDADSRMRAKLMRAELLHSSERFIDAAEAYKEALNENLPPELASQAAHKYAWSLARAGEHRSAIEAFTGFLEQYPESPSAAGATVQRAIAKQEVEDVPGALADFQAVVDRWPEAPEREFALVQIALLHGQKQDLPAMKAAFETLLKEFPQSGSRAQAEFWMGWADFEAGDHRSALPHLEEARRLDAKKYGQRASLRILLSHYYLEDREALAREAAAAPAGTIPPEISRWLGLRSAQEGDFEAAARHLTSLADSGHADAEALIALAESRNALGQNAEALAVGEAFLASTTEPAPRARGFLAIAEARRGLGEFDAAAEAVNEALLLQPEGRLNAVARMASGEIEFSRGDFEEAARAFMSVALLYDDPIITPRALHRASDSYRRARNDSEADKAYNELRERFPDYKLNENPAADT
jgi:TolA-binding protein